MLPRSVSFRVAEAVEKSPSGIASLDVLASLGLCGFDTLKTTLSRLARSGAIVRLKRGVYSANPLRDIFACGQAVFGGYIGFSSALYLHGLIDETPFTVTVVTPAVSGSRSLGDFELLAVALGEKAVGFQRLGGLVVSTRAKTLFDCLYLPKHSVEKGKLLEAFGRAMPGAGEKKEFLFYVKKFAGRAKRAGMLEAAKAVWRK